MIDVCTVQHRAFVVMAEQLLSTHFEHASTLVSMHRSPEQTVVGAIQESTVLAIVVFSNYTSYDVELSVASWSPRWASRAFLRACFSYVFDQLRCDRCTVRVLARNWKARNMVRRLGFRVEGKLRRANAGQNVYVYGMLREECFWLREHGQEISSESTAGT
jgi:RimJ/RimL family protein N-acetyltransferase